MIDVTIKEKLKTKLYPAVDRNVWGTLRSALDQNTHPGVKVLDAGCGEGTLIVARDYRGKIGRLVGIDIQAPKEKKMDEFVVGDLTNIPFKDGTFDIIICYFVIEHLRQPRDVFNEFWRLLADGGIFIFRTPCIGSPLFFLSRFTPVHWHDSVKKIIRGNKEESTFYTYYRCNTAGKVDRTLKSIGFNRKALESVEQMHTYFAFSRVTYAFGLLVSRLIQSIPLTKPMRSQLIGVYRKH